MTKKGSEGKGEGGEEGWWSGTDPEKVSRFLLDWQEKMKEREGELGMGGMASSMGEMMKGWEAWWHEVMAGKGEGGSKDETGYKVPPDAVMGFVLSLLQRCDRLEDRIRVLEEERKRRGD